jgi:hypothetical protein
MWRFDPLDPSTYPADSPPFRARGLAFVYALGYVDKRLVGGRDAFRRELGPRDPFRSYYDQIFVVTGEYDAAALVRLYRVIAAIERKPVGKLIESKTRASAKLDTQGLWKPMLKTSSPEAMAERLPFAFNRYFEPTRAAVKRVAPGRFECEFAGVPAPMNGLYAMSTSGFVLAALELAGAVRATLDWDAPVVTGAVSGVPIEQLSFVATWAPPNA